MNEQPVDRTVERNKREMEQISDPKRINHLINTHLKGKSMYLKEMDHSAEVRLTGADELGRIFIHSPAREFHLNEEATLFRILGRYIELKCRVMARKGEGAYQLELLQAGIARKERKAMRIPVREGEVYIHNIRTSKNKVDATMFTIPTSVKVNFATYEHRLKQSQDYVKIDVYGRRGDLFSEIRKAGLSLFVADTQNPDSYKPEMPGLFDYAALLGGDLTARMMEYKQAKIVSEIIVPIVYITHDQTSIPLGYIHIQSRTEPLPFDTVLELQAAAFEMVDRIRDSNTVLVKVHQRVLDYSRGGMKVIIDHEELKDYLIRQKGFTFDFFFKGQAPITFYGLIRSTHLSRDGELTLGVQLSGTSAREGEMRRYMDNLQTQERVIQRRLEQRKKMMGNK